MTIIVQRSTYGPVASPWGRPALDLSATTMSNAAYKLAYKFFAEKSGNITKVHILLGASNGSPPNYLVGIQGLNTVGDPDGVDFGGSSPGTLAPVPDSVNVVTLASPAAVSIGDAVAAVLYSGATPPDSSNYIRALSEPILYGDGISGSFTSIWSFPYTNAGPTMALEYDDGSILYSLPSTRSAAYYFSSDSDPDEMGVKFSPLFSMTVSGIRWSLPTSYLSAASLNVSFLVYDSGDNVIASAVVTDKDFINDGNTSTIYFTPVNLTAGQTYRMAIRPNTAGISGRMYVYKATFASESAKDSREGFAGFSSTYRTDGGAWTDDPTTVLAMGLIVTAIDIPSGPGTTVDGYKVVGPNMTWGDGLTLSSGNDMTSSSRVTAMRFLVPKSGVVTKIGCYVTGVTGSPPSYKCGIVTLDGSMLPTSTPYSDGAIQEESLSPTGFHLITLSAPVSVTAGDRVAISFFSGDVLPNTSNYVTILVDSLFYAGIGRSLYYTTASWSSNASEGPNMYLEYSDGEGFGMAQTGSSRGLYVRSNTDPDEVGNLFTLAASAMVVGIVLPNYSSGVGSSFTGNIIIYGPSDAEVVNYEIPSRTYVSQNRHPRIPFPSPVSLAADTPYRVVIKPTTATNGDVAPYKYRSISEGGKNAMEGAAGWIATTRTDGGAWTDDSSSVYGIALLISEETIPDNSGEGGGTVVGGEYAYIG